MPAISAGNYFLVIQLENGHFVVPVVNNNTTWPEVLSLKSKQTSIGLTI
ncbi:MAG: hypothetical protein IPN36_14850 [Bacteroidetes bacterium]|nr:hypothetical protein [Bacteroidota bacterium]